MARPKKQPEQRNLNWVERCNLIDQGKCPYGGDCVDKEYPTDCMTNSRCFPFRNQQERDAYDLLFGQNRQHGK